MEPTATATPWTTVQAGQEGNVWRERVKTWPPDQKLWVAEDIIVFYTHDLRNNVAMWAAPAFIVHLPSGSVVHLYASLDDPFHYTNDEGREHLEAVLADTVLMERIVARIPGHVKARGGPLDGADKTVLERGAVPPTPTALLPAIYQCAPHVLDVPCGPGAGVGIAYPYRLYTHCGVRWAYFDGRWWEATPPVTDGSGNPPRGWGNPYDVGSFRKADEDFAVFTAQGGMTADFRALPRDMQYPGKLCS